MTHGKHRRQDDEQHYSDGKNCSRREKTYDTR